MSLNSLSLEPYISPFFLQSRFVVVVVVEVVVVGVVLVVSDGRSEN